MTTNNEMMTAIFRNGNDAGKAYQELIRRGYAQNEISVITSETTRNQYFSNDASAATQNIDAGNKTAEGTGIGAAVGGTVGAIVGAIAAIGTSVVLPGLGLIVAGPLAAALAGAGAGGATGGIIGAFVGSGIPEDRAQEYEAALRDGAIILGFYPRSDTEANEVQDVWKSYNGDMMHR